MIVRLLVAVVVVAAALFAYIYYSVEQRIAQTYTVQTPAIAIPTDAAAIARGTVTWSKRCRCAAPATARTWAARRSKSRAF